MSLVDIHMACFLTYFSGERPLVNRVFRISEMRGGSQASIVTELDPAYIHKTLIAARSPASFYNQSLVSLCIFYSLV